MEIEEINLILFFSSSPNFRAGFGTFSLSQPPPPPPSKSHPPPEAPITSHQRRTPTSEPASQAPGPPPQTLHLNPFAKKDNRGVLGQSFRVEQLSEIVGCPNMADYINHVIWESMLINKTSTFLFTWHVKSILYRAKQWIVRPICWILLYVSLRLIRNRKFVCYTDTVDVFDLGTRVFYTYSLEGKRLLSYWISGSLKSNFLCLVSLAGRIKNNNYYYKSWEG